MKAFLFIALFLCPLFSPAQNTVSLDHLCFFLEGIPLPFCKYTRFQICHSGQREECVYRKSAPTIKKKSEVAQGKCPQNNMTCTERRSEGPDGTVIERTCVCNDPLPQITRCSTQCDRCATDNVVVDLGIECPHFCATPTHCPDVYNGLPRGSRTMDSCRPIELCANSDDNLGGPIDLNQCPVDGPGSSSTASNFAGCCYKAKPGALPNTIGNPGYGLPICD